MYLFFWPYVAFIAYTFLIGKLYNFLYNRDYHNHIIKNTVKYGLPLLCLSLFILPVHFLLLIVFLGHDYTYLMIAVSIYVLNFGYIIGSIPFGPLLTKIFAKKDVREFGSGNTGTTNVLRVAGKTVGLLTLLLDFSKSFIPLILIMHFYLFRGFEGYAITSILAIQMILGHILPIWLQFKGGKGVAVALGVYWAYDLYFGMIATAIWLCTFLLFRYSSLASIAMVLLMIIPPVLCYRTPITFTGVCHTSIFLDYDIVISFGIFTFVCIAIIVILAHYKNIKRLLQGKEEKICLR